MVFAQIHAEILSVHGVFMRVAYVCRALSDDRSGGSGAEVHSLACTVAREGHEVYLVSEGPAGGRAARGGPVHLPVAAPRAGHRYAAEPLQYADRVYDALRALHLTEPLERIEFSDASEGFTVVRARRLLGEFAGVRMVVAPRPGGTAGDPAPSLTAALRRHAEEYCRLYAGAPHEPPEGSPPELVSVVIPVYDQGGYLPAAIESAWRCGYRPLEVLVVDDGSTDPATVAALADRPDCTVLRLPHRGLPAARNAGIARARGRYIVPLDADDLLSPGFVAPAVAALRRHPDLGGVAGNVHNFGLLDHVAVPVGYVPDVSLVVNTFARATAVFRAAALTAVGGYDESLPAYEDWDLYLRLYKAGHDVECAPLIGQRYRRHADSMTFRLTDAERVALVQRLLRGHADLVTAGQPPPLLLTLVDLWKSRYEPSASVAWRDGYVEVST